jgi:hypothetical protein
VVDKKYGVMMKKIVASDGFEYGEVTDAEHAEATSLGEMAFQIYVDRRFGLKVGGSHEEAMKEMKDWDAMMRGEISMEEYEKG